MFNWRELSKGFVKGCLIVLNMISIMTALSTFGFAVVDTKILKQYGEDQATGSLTGDLLIIVICVILVFIALLGCVGAVKENVKILHMYVICILVLVILELLAAIFVSVQRYGLQLKVSEWLREDFFSNSTGDANSQQEHDKLWDELQSTYDCCGLNGPEDYAAVGRPISLSCCSRAFRARTATAQVNMYRACLETAAYYVDGCEDEIIEVLKADADWLFGVVIVTFWFEALGMLLAMWVVNYIKNSVKIYKNTGSSNALIDTTPPAPSKPSFPSTTSNQPDTLTRSLKNCGKISNFETVAATACTIASSTSTIALNNNKLLSRMKLNDMRFYKYFMVLFNIINIILGVGLIVMSIVLTREKKAKSEQQPSISRGVLALFVALALFLIITAVLGCVGALKQHIRTLYVQVCFYIFLISIEVIVAIGVILIFTWAGPNHDLRVNFYKNTTMEEDATNLQAFDRIQVEFHCCGVDGPHDYAIIHREIPSSCCPSAHPLRQGGAKRQLHSICLNDRTYYMRGCEDAIKSRKIDDEKLAAVTCAFILFMEILIIVVSLSMVKRIRSQRRQLQQNLQAHFES